MIKLGFYSEDYLRIARLIGRSEEMAVSGDRLSIVLAIIIVWLIWLTLMVVNSN